MVQTDAGGTLRIRAKSLGSGNMRVSSQAQRQQAAASIAT